MMEVMETDSLGGILITTAVSFVGVILGSAALDFILIRPMFIPKAQYFALHACFNLFVMIIVAKECFMEVLPHPLNVFDVERTVAGVASTSAIGAFHVYHFLISIKIFGGPGLNLEDLMHHLISGMAVPVLGIAVPYGKVLSLVNFNMCGFPGGLDYCMLVAVKYGWMHRMTEKNVNRMLNLLMRMPAMQLTGYLIAVNLWSGSIPIASQPVSIFFMVFGWVVHTANAVYYCDKVVGNSWVCAAQEKGAKAPKQD